MPTVSGPKSLTRNFQRHSGISSSQATSSISSICVVSSAAAPPTIAKYTMPSRCIGSRPPADRKVPQAEPLHGLDGLVGEAALAADRAHAVLRAERLGEGHHARARRRADAQLLVLPPALGVSPDPADVRRGVEQERAREIHRRLDTLVEDPDLRPVANADDVALHRHLVAGAELQQLALVRDRKRQLVRRHQAATLPGT